MAQKAEGDTYPTPEHGWVCFHCGEHFPGTHAGWKDAGLHFGAGFIDSIPACRLRLRAGEKSLLRRIRWLERKNRELLRQLSEEDAACHRELYAARSEHRRKLITAEEEGYAKGLADGRKIAETGVEP